VESNHAVKDREPTLRLVIASGAFVSPQITIALVHRSFNNSKPMFWRSSRLLSDLSLNQHNRGCGEWDLRTATTFNSEFVEFLVAVRPRDLLVSY
jgi:hypothetical protein